jgi:hypothetical protein
VSNSNLPIQNQDFGCKVLHVSFYTTHRKTLLINNLQKIEIEQIKDSPLGITEAFDRAYQMF